MHRQISVKYKQQGRINVVGVAPDCPQVDELMFRLITYRWKAFDGYKHHGYQWLTRDLLSHGKWKQI